MRSIETLENRRLMVVDSYALLDSSGILRVYGTNQNDKIDVHIEYSGNSNGKNAIIVTSPGIGFGDLLKFDWYKVKRVIIYGLEGNDQITIGGNQVYTVPEAPQPPQLWLSTLIYGGSGKDYIVGSEKSDTLNGGPGNDYLVGNGGNDSLFGNEGNDQLIPGKGNDLLDGGLGLNSADYSDRTDDLTLSLYNPSDTFVSIHDIAATPNGAAGEKDYFFGISRIVGGKGNDTIYGSTFRDTLIGGGGDDSIIGNGDDDYLLGGDGNDFIDSTIQKNNAANYLPGTTVIDPVRIYAGSRIVGGMGVDRAIAYTHDVVIKVERLTSVPFSS